jgi:hypothetical protein
MRLPCLWYMPKIIIYFSRGVQFVNWRIEFNNYWFSTSYFRFDIGLDSLNVFPEIIILSQQKCLNESILIDYLHTFIQVSYQPYVLIIYIFLWNSHF